MPDTHVILRAFGITCGALSLFCLIGIGPLVDSGTLTVYQWFLCMAVGIFGFLAFSGVLK